MEPEKTKIKKYEFVYWLKPDIQEKTLDAVLGEMKSLVEKLGGKVLQEKDIVREHLAYPIKRFRDGFLKISLIEALPEKINELNKNLKFNAHILRYVIGRAEDIKQKPLKSKISDIVRKFKMPTVPVVLPVEKKAEIPLPTPSVAKPEEKKIKLEEVDKKLEEILGKEF